MIKVETVMKDNDIFSIQYEAENTNTLEHLMLISKIVETILEQNIGVTEKDIMKFIKDRKKNFDKLDESESEE